ncbi:potassium-transporting ATPase subunit KdpC [Salinisphaera orenii]|uniref:potassium-transporting ATPase subunit KdpC n=1 Tax=Salinisphaera orenii TaxID=856731 RepID=UPI000DBE6A9C
MNEFASNQTPDFNTSWIPALRAALVLMVLCGGIYPAITTMISGTLFPWQSTGSLIVRDGQPVGSALVGQPFVSNRYFYGRPSAAGYDPTAVSGSDWAPNNPELRARADKRSAQIAARENVSRADIPVNLIAASGSGLDPHVSPQAAYLQAERVAQARDMPVTEVHSAIQRHIKEPVLGVLGDRRVNVLELNLALDTSSGNT